MLNQIAKRHALAAGRLGRPGPLDQHAAEFDGGGDFEAGSYGGRNFHFGIREHAMGAICNGMALSGLRPYGATFFVFTDYMRPSIRLAAIMGLPVVLRLHPRFDRRRRGRPDAPADRATGRVAGDSQSAGDSPRRRQRSGRGLQGRDAAERHRPAALVLRGRTCPRWTARSIAPAAGAQGRLRAGRRRRRQAGGDSHRHRQRGLALRRPPTRSSPPKASRPAW